MQDDGQILDYCANIMSIISFHEVEERLLSRRFQQVSMSRVHHS